jgi:hypothetical protein
MVVMFVDCCVGYYGIFGTIPTVGILRGGSFLITQEPISVNLLMNGLGPDMPLKNLLNIMMGLQSALQFFHVSLP